MAAVRGTGRAHDRGVKAITVLAGITLMVAVVLIAFGVLSRYAGGWGVPFFTFQTQYGSVCTNTFTGFRCDQLTAADVGYYAEFDVPADATIESASYETTHDYTLAATVSVPKSGAAAALVSVRKAFGGCDERPTTLPSAVSTDCVVTNDDYSAQSEAPTGRSYVVSTGLREDGSRVIRMDIASR